MSIKDSWNSVEAYELFMGRWSRLTAETFLGWLSPERGMKWLDVGCGSGALSETIIKNCAPKELTAVDQSEAYVKGLEERLGKTIRCKVGDATALPVESDSVDYTVSGLALNFIDKPIQALKEMNRVTSTSGTVAVYVWDYSGTMDLLNRFWEAAVKLNPQASKLHEGNLFADANPETMSGWMDQARFANIETAPVEIEMLFKNFADYWDPFFGGQGPAPSYLVSLDEPGRQQMKETVLQTLPIQDDGSIPLRARAWAIKGTPTR